MNRTSRPILRIPSDLSFILLAALLGVLWLAGGASRADVMGQVLVRGATWGLLIVAVLLGKRFIFMSAFSNAKPILLLLGAAILLAMIQLIPLPPALWQALPGHAPFAEAADVSGQAQPWRPWAIVPDTTINALGSLVVPLAALFFAASLKEQDHKWLLAVVLGLVVASTLLGLLQVSGVSFDNPLINDTRGEVSGSFANRNHFALFLALGCLVAPVWAFTDGRGQGLRGVVALGMVLLFALTILASGSRAGMIVGAGGVGLGLLLVWRPLARLLRRYPRWVLFALVAGIVALILTFVLISIAADRAASIDRVFTADVGQDMRRRGLPTVLAMIRTYFPMGSGLGGFDPVFRMHEPFGLLKLTYFNRAHNDFLEIALDAGVPGMALLLAALVWWARASIRAWRAGSDASLNLAKLGSAMILLILIASIFDYPARTPMMMAMVVIAGIWLNSGARKRRSPALPGRA